MGGIFMREATFEKDSLNGKNIVNDQDKVVIEKS